MKSDAINRINQLGIVHVRQTMTTEGEGFGNLVFLNVLDTDTTFDAANHIAIVVTEEANATKTVFENAFPRENWHGKCLQIVTNDLPILTGDDKFSRSKN